MSDLFSGVPWAVVPQRRRLSWPALTLACVLHGIAATSVWMVRDPPPPTAAVRDETVDVAVEAVEASAPAPPAGSQPIPDPPRAPPPPVEQPSIESPPPAPTPAPHAERHLRPVARPVTRPSPAIPHGTAAVPAVPAEATPSPPDTAMAPAPAPPAPPSAEAAAAWRAALGAWLQTHRIYPEAARRDGVEGRVLVRFTLDRDGAVAGVTVVTGSGSPLLDDAAVAMLRGARLPPPPAGDSPTVTLPVRYSLAR